MFDDLSERIKRDDIVETTRRERLAKAIAIPALAILLFGGLYFVVQMAQ